METLWLFLKAVVVGLGIAAPVGPVGVLCIRRTVNEGRLVGLVSGLGAAAADAVYGAVAGFGVAWVADTLIAYEDPIRLVGGIVLIGIGLKAWRTPPALLELPSDVARLAEAAMSCFILTLANPATILSFIAIFAGFGLIDSVQTPQAVLVLVAGVFVGSALWWLSLCWGSGALRRSITPVGLRWLNRGSGSLIMGFGVAAIGSTAF